MRELFKELEIELLSEHSELPAEPPTEEKYAVEDESKAEWVVGKLTSLDEKEQLVKGQAAAILKDIANDRRRLDFLFGTNLRQWAQKSLLHGKKTLKLLTGTLSFRKVPGGLKVVDEKAAIAWAKLNKVPAVEEKVVEKLSKDFLQKHMEATGELPDGCEVKEEYQSFSVKGAKGA